MSNTATDEVVGSIHIIYYQDPSLPPKVTLGGEITHRQLLASHQHVNKGFRKYMTEKRQKLIKETSEDE